MRVAIVSNGNAFSTFMLAPLFEAGDVDVAGAVLVRIPPGKGGPASRLWRLSRKTGLRYTRHKAATIALPAVYGAATRRPVFLDGLSRRHGTPSISVPTVNGEDARAFLERCEPDVLLSVSSPERIEPGILAIPRVAAVNIHWALLPRYAGVAPYFWVLRHREPRTGLTVHVMAEKLDVGSVLRQRVVEILPQDTSLSLQLRLAEAGREELLAALHELPASLERARDQDLSERSYFGWPTAADVAALYGRGRKLASIRDYRRLLELLGGRRSMPTRESASAYSLRS